MQLVISWRKGSCDWSGSHWMFCCLLIIWSLPKCQSFWWTVVFMWRERPQGLLGFEGSSARWTLVAPVAFVVMGMLLYGICCYMGCYKQNQSGQQPRSLALANRERKKQNCIRCQGEGKGWECDYIACHCGWNPKPLKGQTVASLGFASLGVGDQHATLIMDFLPYGGQGMPQVVGVVIHSCPPCVFFPL